MTRFSRASDEGGETSSTDCPERRRAQRDVCQRPLVGVPVLRDGRPDHARQMTGITTDWSHGGLGLELDAFSHRPVPDLVVGVQGPDGALQFAGVRVCHQATLAPARVHVNCQFGGVGQELLEPDVLLPRYDAESMTFATRFPTAVFEAWCELGVLESYVADRVQLCPRCHGLPTFRSACRQCGSAEVGNDQLIHHFACAHVGMVGDFETPAGLVCPKCRTRQLIVSSDYEYVTGPYRCGQCHWTDMELEQTGQCLRCSFRFPAHQAHVQDLRGFRAHRLDSLAAFSPS